MQSALVVPFLMVAVFAIELDPSSLGFIREFDQRLTKSSAPYHSNKTHLSNENSRFRQRSVLKLIDLLRLNVLAHGRNASSHPQREALFLGMRG
ncbi:unnamed protein product [Anisakis simplex]|uniref:Secreted protein n=1 Tax=Anisakis simplex TaxID=6269 RepID=A0A0M3K9U6_ANISI|nr:unnamed protein product [Anisakis simplex]